MKIYAVAIQKGGTGKTITTAALSQAAVYRGLKTLAIDLDPQGNLSFVLAADPNRPGCYDLLHGAPAADLIQHSPQGMDVITAGRNLSAETSAQGSARRLQNALAPIRGQYDVIFIDTPTAAGELLYNALQAATGVIFPLQADSFNLQSLYLTADLVKQMQRSNPALQFSGIVITQNDGRSNIVKAFVNEFRGKSAAYNIPFLGIVRQAHAVIKEIIAFQQSLYEYAPKSNPARDYLAVFDYLRMKNL